MLAGGWVIYFALHSLMATHAVKKIAGRLLKSGYRFYRLLYNAIAFFGLVVLLIINGRLQSPYYFDREGFIRYLSLMLTTFGVMTIQLAFRQYRLKAFLGFVEEEGKMKVRGILQRVRHPIYTGLILITLGFFLFIPNHATLITTLCIFVYLPVGIYFEEKKLIVHFGQEYLDYRQRVPSLVPRLKGLFGG